MDSTSSSSTHRHVVDLSEGSTSGMRPSPRPAIQVEAARARKLKARPSSLQLPLSMPSPPPPTQPSPDRPSNPILRWFKPESTSTPASAPPSRKSFPNTPQGSNTPNISRTPSPLSSLQDALNSDLPQLPQAAHHGHPPTSLFPNAHRGAQHSLAYPPSFLRELTHTTLPTASLSYGSDELTRGPISPSYSPPQHTSLETLRSLQSNSARRTNSLKRSPTRSPKDARSFSTSFTPSWWWSQSENKENVDQILDESDRGETVDEERERIRRKYLAPNNPIVFCHGLLGFDTVAVAGMEFDHWRGVKEVLEQNGCEVLITRVPATSSPADRAAVLEERIEQVYPGRSIHLIGHSMGGLDCRYLTSRLRKHTFSVLSVTTIATPHRGSAFADQFLAYLGHERLPSFVNFLDMLPIGGGDGAAFTSLTRDSMKKFNEETPDQPDVRYFSWGAMYEPGLIDTWKISHGVVLEKEGPNDGLVSVESAKWGTYLGTLTDVNHLDLVGWVNPARYKWAELRGKAIKFKAATFYLGAADLLAREVEGQAALARDENVDEDDPMASASRRAQMGGDATVEDLGRQVAGEGSKKDGATATGQGLQARLKDAVARGSGDKSKQMLLADDEPWDARSEPGSEAGSPPRSS